MSEMPRPKKVAIIGGGPAGLATAKIMLHAHPPGTFEPTVFERSAAVGGMWPTEPSMTGRLNPQMPANVSRYIVSFSDLAWEAIGNTAVVSNASTKSSANGEYIPIFPKAWHVGRYLQKYADKYLPPETVKLDHEVVHARQTTSGKWEVEWRQDAEWRHYAEPKQTAQTQPGVGPVGHTEFDCLVIATGFFASPRNYDRYLPDVSRRVPIFHSSEAWNLAKHLSFKTEKSARPTKVVVVGGGLSGVEAATLAVSQLSSRKWSPTSSGFDGDFEIIHLARRPIWILPYFIPSTYNPVENETGHKFLVPADFSINDVARRLPEPIAAHVAPSQPGTAKMIHGLYGGFVGYDQKDLSNGSLGVTEEDLGLPSYLGISESYAQFARSDIIKFVRGSLSHIGDSSDGQCSLNCTDEDGKEFVLDQVDCVIMANGYDSKAALRPLSDEILSKLEADFTSHSIPVVLGQACTYNSSVPTLAFAGFYQGAFWGLIEMQARGIAARWAGGVEVEGLPDQDTARAMRANQRDSKLIQQFPMGDFLGIVETFARGLGIKRAPVDLPSGVEATCMPARYLDTGSDKEQAKVTLASFKRDILAISELQFVARSVFHAVAGRWKVYRKLDSAISSYPSGVFEGQAHFHPRDPTDEAYDAEYLYVEEGLFTTASGMEFNGSRRYVYRYQEFCDRLSVWFVKPEDQKSVDYFFHDLNFTPRTPASKPNVFEATSSHLCIKDLYTPSYEFKFEAVRIPEFVVQYDVKGPEKDYKSHTTYSRSS